MNFIGLDAGSVSVKLVILDSSGTCLHRSHKRHRGQPLQVALELLREVLDNSASSENFSLSLTGSAGRILGPVLGIKPVNEVVAFSFAMSRLYPHIRTVIEMGGEDSKLIFINDTGDAPSDFAMNSICAAGTGSFLDQQAERLRMTIQEFSSLSLTSAKPPRIAGRCSVFAKSDMIHLQQIATPVEDIIAGLCFAVARNFKGSISQGRHLVKPVAFLGGVAANQGMIRAFKDIFCLDDLFVPEDHVFIGAFGAALKNIASGPHHSFQIKLIEDFLSNVKPSEKMLSPLIAPDDDFCQRHVFHSPGISLAGGLDTARQDATPVKAYLGIDIGSISTNLAVIDDNRCLLAKRYLMTAGRPIEAVRQGLREIHEELGHSVTICGVGTTGSGRYMIADYIGADIVKNEITAQATAAVFIEKTVDTIFEIGGQDSKYISLRDGVVVDFEMNKACAAGTGSFLEEQAEKLGVAIKDEFQIHALNAPRPSRLGERCTVFMENSLMACQQRGTGQENLLAGLAYSIVQNYISRVVGKRRIGENIFFQGGVAFNKAVVAAFEQYLGRTVTVPPHHDVTGAIGMALIASDFMKKNGHNQTAFKGFELSRRPYAISSFSCGGCPNLCEINRVKVEEDKGHLFYGGRCEKYDVRREKSGETIADLFSFREERLWEAHYQYRSRFEKKSGNGSGPSGNARHAVRIGIPYIFFFQDFLPFWSTLLWEAGFEVVVSPTTDRTIIDAGLENVLSETCFPVKAAHGHITHLLNSRLDAILLPSFIDLNSPADSYVRGLACPYTQTVPYLANITFSDCRLLIPVINNEKGPSALKPELCRIFKPFGISSSRISKALAAAQHEQERFNQSIREKGRECLNGLDRKGIVIVGRAYNAFDRGMNLNIARKLAALGVQPIPMDFLTLDSSEISRDWPHMYWRSGQRILSAARQIRSNPQLHALYIGNFSCGPDSFITKFFEDEMAGKPHLHLELDAHSADAGIITRCEAFLDSLKNAPVPDARTSRCPSPAFNRNRTIFIPRMSDHAFAIAAAFEHCGLTAEVLPEPTRQSVDIGKKYVTGKECYPCAVTTGDIISKITEPGFLPEKAAFFMPSGSGPCRFGQYSVFHRMLLQDLGITDIPIIAPVQNENFYKDLDMAGSNFASRSWEGVIAIGLLNKCVLETRPYEQSAGASDNLYSLYLPKICDAVRGANGHLEKLLKQARQDFEHIPRCNESRPRIGIVGEIFVRSNRFSNDDLVRKVENLGAEVYLAPVEEWIFYINYTGFRRTLIKKDWSGMIKLSLKRLFQKRIEHRFGRHFSGYVKTLHEPDTKELLDKASPYIHPSFEGETILSIGKSIDLIQRGCAGIISAMPFGCMPGTIVSGIMRGLSRDSGIPCLSIPYDGTESVTAEIQLEAFVEQAREYFIRMRKEVS